MNLTPLGITIGSVYVLTALIWIVRRIFKCNTCPICVGVSLTWVWMAVGMKFALLPVAQFQLPAALLLGGSVVGIAYALEKKRNRSSLLFKTVFITNGIAVAYAFMMLAWLLAAALAVLLVIVAVLLKPKHHARTSSNAIEHALQDCC